MASPVDHALLLRLSGFLAREMGLHFPPERWPDLVRGMEAAAHELGYADTAACAAQLLSSPPGRRVVEILASHLTVGETYFFREPQVFEALRTEVLPPLIQARRRSGQHLRLWSAGCSTGEEAYSLAILLQRMIPDFRQWNITILGTDINPQALRKAAAGIYGEWSFRDAPPWLQAEYFHAARGGQHAIVRAVREMVTFSYLNLAEDTYPSLANNTNAMDIILCRNVLMYLEPQFAASVVCKHHQALVEDGWLVVSPAEISQASFSRFVPANFPGAILHRKVETASRPAPAGARPPPPAAPAEAAGGAAPGRESRPPTHRQAQALYRQGNYAEAAAEAARLLARQRDDTEAMTLLARIHANRGELPAALRWCEQAIDSDRLNPLGHYLRAAILEEEGRLEEAMLSYKRTLYLDHEFVLAHFSLGNLFRRQGRLREGRKHFENALLLLGRHGQDDILPESDGITAGRMAEIIRMGLDLQEKAA